MSYYIYGVPLSHTSNVRYIAFSMKSDLSSYHLATT